MSCPRCRYDHPPLSPTAWLWVLRDAKERPATAGHLGVLAMMAARVDPTTGCGWMRRGDLMADAGVKKETVTAAAQWAIGTGLLARLVTGRGRGAAQSSWSLFALADPSRAETGAFDNGRQERKRAPLTPGQERKWAQSRAEMGAPDVRPGLVRPEVRIPPPPGPAASRAETGAPDARAAGNGSDPALFDPPAAAPQTDTQRSKRLTDAYAKAEPMCKWVAVNGVVLKAIRSRQFSDEEIRDALLRLAGEGRSVTVDTLRTELRGLPATRQGAPPGPRGQPAPANPRDEWMTNRS
jgi:hypothetical protein